jgi:hypothetical protein
MLEPSLIIPRIREACPIFGMRVAGALALRSAIESDDLPVPHAFVVPLHDQGEGDAEISPLAQGMPARFGVVVAVPNTTDEPGLSAASKLLEVRRQLLEALIGFQPGEDYAPVLYDRMPEPPDFNRARAWAQFDFTSYAYTTGAAGMEGA